MSTGEQKILTGRTLGDFVVKEKIGEGGFGAVFRAEQPMLGREVVIKILHALSSAGVKKRIVRIMDGDRAERAATIAQNISFEQ